MLTCILIVHFMPGGSLTHYAGLAAVMRDAGCEVRIEGDCRSACLTLLSVACVTPDARLVVHLPSIDTPHWREVMTRDWPPALGAWYRDLPPGTGPIEVTGDWIVQGGGRGC